MFFAIAGSGTSPVLLESNWGAVIGDAQTMVKEDVPDANVYTITLDLEAGDEFQFAINSSWNDQRGCGYLTAFSQDGKDYFQNAGSLGDAGARRANIKCLIAGNYTFTLTTYPGEDDYAILHIPDSRYCFAVGEKELVLRLRMSREDDGTRVSLIYAQKYDFTLKRQKQQMKVCYRDRLYSYYEIRLMLQDVRFAYLFEIEEDGEIYYFSEDGVTRTYRFEEGFYNFFQMPYINQNDVLKTVDWMRDAVFYQIFIDRFYQGNQKKIPVISIWHGAENRHLKVLQVMILMGS